MDTRIYKEKFRNKMQYYVTLKFNTIIKRVEFLIENLTYINTLFELRLHRLHR